MERLSRRQFLKYLTYGAAALAGRELINSTNFNETPAWLEDPIGWSFTTSNNLPNSLNGTHVATPFLYLKPKEVIEKHLGDLGGSLKSATIFIDDKFEKELRIYERGVLERAKNYADILAQRDMDIMVVLSDFFTMRPTWNPTYGSHGATSPYAIYGEGNFYGDPLLREYFIRRIKLISSVVKNFPNLRSVTIANEPIPRSANPNDGDFIVWFNKMIVVVKELFPETPVLSGVANPYFISDEIKGLDANTAHVYLHDPASVAGSLQYLRDGNLPLFFQEFGVAERVFGMPMPFTDQSLALLARQLLIKTSRINHQKKEVQLQLTSLTFWKKDAYDDGFNFDRRMYPETHKIAQALFQISKKLRLVPKDL